MRVFAILAATFFSFGLFAENIQMCPLWEEDTHFQQYRCLMIESSISRIEEQLDKLECPEKRMIQEEINLIKLNLGYPPTVMEQ